MEPIEAMLQPQGKRHTHATLLSLYRLLCWKVGTRNGSFRNLLKILATRDITFFAERPATAHEKGAAEAAPDKVLFSIPSFPLRFALGLELSHSVFEHDLGHPS